MRICSQAILAQNTEYMVAPKVFIKWHLDARRGGIIRPRFNYTLVYVKRGIFFARFRDQKKLEESMGERGSAANWQSLSHNLAYES